MDELVYLHLIEILENDELREQNLRVNNIFRNPFEELSDEMFRKMFRLSKELCEFLILSLEPYIKPKIRPTDLSVINKILVALRFFGSGSYQLDIGRNTYLSVSQATVSRCIKEVVSTINRPEIFNQWVKFPNNFEELNALRLSFYEKHNIAGVIGCIDCTHIAIFPPKRNDPEYPEHIYVNRKGYHSINTQLICDTNLKVLSVNALYPGSTNDSFIWSNSNVQAFLRTLHGLGHTNYYLLGDSGYPLRTWLLTPLEYEPAQNTPEYRYNQTHKSTRCLIERCNGVLKMRFRCLLKHRVLHYAPEVASQIINACVALHNLCIEHNVPVPDDNEEEIDFGFLHIGADENGNGAGIVNPELTAGRRARQRLIRNFFDRQ